MDDGKTGVFYIILQGCVKHTIAAEHYIHVSSMLEYTTSVSVGHERGSHLQEGVVRLI